MSMAGFVRVDKASIMTQLSRSALARLVKKNELRADVIGGRQFFYRDDLARFMEERGGHLESEHAEVCQGSD